MSTDQATLRCALLIGVRNVSEVVNRVDPRFLFCFRIDEISNLGAAMILQVLHLLIQKITKNFAFFLCFLLKVRPLHLKEDCLETHCNRNKHCFKRNWARFLYTKMLAVCVCTF